MPAPFKPDIEQANCDTGDENLMDQLCDSSSDKAQKPTPAQQESFRLYRHNTSLAPPGPMRRVSLRRKSVAAVGRVHAAGPAR